MEKPQHPPQLNQQTLSQNKTVAAHIKPEALPSVAAPRIVSLDNEPNCQIFLLASIYGWFQNPVVTKCIDGDAAAQILERSGPDLFITDVCHPGKCVEELLMIQVQKRQPYPVILCTGCSSTEHLIGLAQQHDVALSVLEKPYTKESVWKILEQLFGPSQNADPQMAMAVWLDANEDNLV